ELEALVPLEPPPEQDWPGVMLTAPTVPAKGATMLASFTLDWADVSWAWAEACCAWADASDAWSDATVCEVALDGSAASFASAELTAALAAFSEDCAAVIWAPNVVVSSVATVTPAATCWPGCTVTAATRPLVAKSRLA